MELSDLPGAMLSWCGHRAEYVQRFPPVALWWGPWWARESSVGLLVAPGPAASTGL